MSVREIGGDFCLADLLCPVEPESAYSRLLARWEQQAYLSIYSSGRSAYYAILKHIAAEADYSLRVLLPSYLCHTMLEPVRAAGLDAVFYKVRANLSIDVDDLARLMRTGPSVIVICDYFGFRGSLQVLDDLHLPMTDDHFVLYDATHSALDQEPWKTAVWKPDVCVVSLRKTLPVADGAFAIWPGRVSISGPQSPAALSESASLRSVAMLLKAWYLLHGQGDKNVYLSMYRQSESLVDEEYQQTGGMSLLSRSMLEHVDFRKARTSRRDNYLRLLEMLGNVEGVRPLFPVLPDDVYPLGFPIVADCRDELRAYLTRNDIYCPIHWVLPDDIPVKKFPESHGLSQRILTIPCDQRHTALDMTTIGKAVLEFIKSR